MFDVIERRARSKLWNATEHQGSKRLTYFVRVSFLSVKKPPSIFVIVFIDRSSQWNAVISQNIFIFIGSCYNYTVSIVSTEKFVSRKLISMISPH